VDYSEISKYLQGKSYHEIKLIIARVRKINAVGQEAVIKEILNVEKQRKVFGEKSVRIPEVKWADVGGLADAKDDIL
jgi:SpoVK/Ycf46/Vps4 family AAA+-type ATPase